LLERRRCALAQCADQGRKRLRGLALRRSRRSGLKVRAARDPASVGSLPPSFFARKEIAMRDLVNSLAAAIAIAAATYDADNTPAAVDLQGFEGAVLAIHVGVGGITFTG